MKCKYCGKDLPIKSRNKTCSKECRYSLLSLNNRKIRICIECGGVVPKDRGKSNFCSKECVKKQYKKRMIEKYGVDSPLKLKSVRDKIKKTKLEKYGHEHFNYKKIKDNLMDLYGVDNNLSRLDVKEKIKQTNLHKYDNIYAIASDEIKEKIKTSVMSKYGVDHIFKIDEVKEKIKQTHLDKWFGVGYGSSVILNKIHNTNLERYNTIYPTQNNEIKDKIKQNNLNKYGVEYVLSLPDVINKRKSTNLNIYGVECVFQSEIIKDKIKQTNLNKYGVEYVSQRDDIKDKVKKTNLITYGSECVLSSEIIRDKIKQTNLNKYGVECVFQSETIKDKIKNTCLEKYNAPSLFHSVYMKELRKQNNMLKYGVPYYCMTEHCRSSQNKGRGSKINKEFGELFNITEFEFPLENKSFDLKKDNILVEINPSYTHNQTRHPWYNRQLGGQLKLDSEKDINYHKDKSDLAKKHGYQCIHVFDWDDPQKIKYIFDDKETIAARKCEIREVTKHDNDIFLNQFHLQNSCNGQSIRYGLYHEGLLIQVMTFGKPRYNKKYDYELLRLCSHARYKIIGGSERLFKKFTEEHKPENIISYCDNAKFSGEVYKKLGFQCVDAGAPGCIWSKGKDKITANLLKQRGFDQLFGASFGKGTSNRDLMIEHGWVEVYDCGQSVWVYK